MYYPRYLWLVVGAINILPNWYPHLRLIHQETYGNWEDVMNKVDDFNAPSTDNFISYSSFENNVARARLTFWL